MCVCERVRARAIESERERADRQIDRKGIMSQEKEKEGERKWREREREEKKTDRPTYI